MAGTPAISSIVFLARMNEIWPVVVGSYIAKHTCIKSIKFRKLEITTDVSAIRTEILMRKAEIIAQINELAGKFKITEISIF